MPDSTTTDLGALLAQAFRSEDINPIRQPACDDSSLQDIIDALEDVDDDSNPNAPDTHDNKQLLDACENGFLLNEFDRSRRVFRSFETGEFDQEVARITQTGKFWLYRVWCNACHHDWVTHREVSDMYICPSCNKKQYLHERILKKYDQKVLVIVKQLDRRDNVKYFILQYPDINGNHPKGGRPNLAYPYTKTCLEIVEKKVSTPKQDKEDYIIDTEVAIPARENGFQTKGEEKVASWIIGKQFRVYQMVEGKRRIKFDVCSAKYARLHYVWTGIEWVPGALLNHNIEQWTERAEYWEFRDWQRVKNGHITPGHRRTVPEKFDGGHSDERTPEEHKVKYEKDNGYVELSVEVERVLAQEVQDEDTGTTDERDSAPAKAQGRVRGSLTRARLKHGASMRGGRTR